MSLGVANLESPMQSLVELLDSADQHLLQAKRSGRDCVVYNQREARLTVVPSAS